MTMRFLAALLLLTLAGCTSSTTVASSVATPSAAGGSPSASTPPPQPGVLVERQCGGGAGGGGCNAGFALDGKHYFISCEPVSPGSVADEAMGGGVLYGRQVTVRRITVGTNADQVAVGPMEDYCGPGTVAPGYYVVAPPGAP